MFNHQVLQACLGLLGQVGVRLARIGKVCPTTTDHGVTVREEE